MRRPKWQNRFINSKWSFITFICDSDMSYFCIEGIQQLRGQEDREEGISKTSTLVNLGSLECPSGPKRIVIKETSLLQI